MKLIIENWRKFLNEEITDDILDTIADLEKRKKAAQAGSKTWQPTGDETDWKKFKQWRDFTRAHEAGVASSGTGPYDHAQPPEQPEDFEKAVKQKSSQKYEDILQYNCEIFRKDLRRLFHHSISCDDLKNATQGLNPGKGSPSQIFSNSRYVKIIGTGGFGVAALFENDHIVKIFHGGVGARREDPLKGELEGYQALLDSQLAGVAKSYDLAVYEFGTIPTHPGFVGYAEIGKVIPFGNWSSDNFDMDVQEDIEIFLWSDLAVGLEAAWRADKVKTFDQVDGGAKEYIDYIMNGDPKKEKYPTAGGPWEGIKAGGLNNVSTSVHNYGWRSNHKDDPGYYEMPPIPPALHRGKGKKFLHSLLTAVYRASKLNGGIYLYGPQTSDIHEGNFGISYQTGEVIIFDR